MADAPLPVASFGGHHDLLTGPSNGELRRLFDLSLQMLCIAGLDGYFKAVNPAFEKTLGFPPDELLSRPFIEFVHPDDREATLNEFGKLSQGILTVQFENRYCCRDGSYRTLHWTSRPAEEDHLLYATALDITDRKRAEEDRETDFRIQRAVSTLLRVVLEPIPLEEQLQSCLKLLLSIPWIAIQAKGAVFLIEEDPAVLVMKTQVGFPAELPAEYSNVPLEACLCARAGAKCRVEFADHDQTCHHAQNGSLLCSGHYCVPIVSDGVLQGVLNLYVEQGHEETDGEARLLSSVADILAGAVKHHRTEQVLRERDAQLIAAHAILEHLLPNAPLDLPGFDIWGASYPAEFVAGDVFDYLPMASGSVGFVMGDVSGHGFSSALLMALTCARLRSLAESGIALDAILARVNAALVRETEGDRFVTLLFARLDPESRTLRYANAGHPPGIVLDRAGNLKAQLASTAIPLGILHETTFPVAGPIALEPGETVVLLTDGVLEAGSAPNDLFGIGRVVQTVRAHLDKPAREITESLRRAVCEFSQRQTPLDDVTVVVIKVLPS